MIKKFVSPNLKYKNGKIYILNKYEINNKDWNYEQENYYIIIDEIQKTCDNCTIELVVNDLNDDILIVCNIDDNINENEEKDIFTKINNNLCELKY